MNFLNPDIVGLLLQQSLIPSHNAVPPLDLGHIQVSRALSRHREDAAMGGSHLIAALLNILLEKRDDVWNGFDFDWQPSKRSEPAFRCSGLHSALLASGESRRIRIRKTPFLAKIWNQFSPSCSANTGKNSFVEWNHHFLWWNLLVLSI